MIKIIGKILPLLVVLSAVVLLAVNAGKAGAQSPTQPTTGAVTEPAGTTAQTTAPTAIRSGIVAEILEAKWLDETALSVCICEPALLEREEVRGFGRHANGFELAGLCDEMKMNPVAAFWLLVEEGLYQKTPDDTGVLGTPAFRAPEGSRKTYPNTAEGAGEMLTDLLRLAGEVPDGLELEKKVLGSDAAVDPDQIFERPGECRYAYFVYYGEQTAHILCCYLRGGENISDVEFQLLNLRYAGGPAEVLEEMDAHGERQAAALMAAAELLLTGSSRADQGRIPFDYSLNGHSVHVERFSFSGEGETGRLTNYRIQQ